MLLVLSVLAPVAAAAPPIPVIEEEIHYYREVTGTTAEEAS